MSTPRAQGVDLRLLSDAAEDGAGGQAGLERQRREGGVDLPHELTGRSQDQGAGCALPRLRAVGETGDQREEEGVGLAGAGAAPAQDVAARHRVRQGRGLDRGWSVDALSGEDGGQACGHAECVERRQGKPNLCGVSPKPGAGTLPGGYARSRYELRRADNSRRELDELMRPAYWRYVESVASSRPRLAA